MKFQRVITMSITILVLILLNLTPSNAQIRGGQVYTFSGVIGNISTDFEFIIVNEIRISLSSRTKIMDEKGNTLALNDLKLRTPITIEVLTNKNKFLAKTIVVKSKWK